MLVGIIWCIFFMLDIIECFVSCYVYVCIIGMYWDECGWDGGRLKY